MQDGKAIKIAIIDDDEDDFIIISDFIKEIEGKEYEIDWLKNAEDASSLIRSRSHHLYFVDYFLGPITGLDLLKEAATHKVDRPIVLLTGFGNKDVDIKAMECGATDYLIKSELTSEKLERCIRYSLERAKFLEELKSRETRYRTLFEGSKDAVFIADTSLNFIEANQSTISLLDTYESKIKTHSLYDYLKDEVQKARLRNLISNAGKINDLEVTLNKDNEEVKICLLSLYVISSENEQVVHGILHDITEFRKAELLKLQAQKLEANERLIRILAHEIRNPLNNIILAVEHLMPEDDKDGTKDFLNIIHRNALRINQIISELLGLASPSQLAFEKYSLQEIIEESLANASDRIKLNHVELDKQYPEKPMIIEADKSKLVIAFNNILINAIEALNPTNGKLSIKLQETADAYTVSIRDNGRGIPEEYLAKLFEPFFTLKKNGMGLGLTASFSIIQSHKAKIYVDSKEGEGTRFNITFNKT